MMRGIGCINIKTDQHDFHEHPTYGSALVEARRLAAKLGAPVTIYVPLTRIDPPRDVSDTRIELPSDAAQYIEDYLPF